MRGWANATLDAISEIGQRLDISESGTPYQDAVATMRARIADMALTPSARLMREMEEAGESFSQFAHRLSMQHAETFRSRRLPAQRQEFFEAEARDSHVQRSLLEAKPDVPFDEYLHSYLGQQPAQSVHAT